MNDAMGLGVVGEKLSRLMARERSDDMTDYEGFRSVGRLCLDKYL